LSSRFLLRVRCRNPTTAKKLAAVLAPDNRVIPSDQRLAMTVASNSVALKVDSERTRSGFNTVRSILRDVALFREIWLISREKGG
jgi:hypothetical protein